MNKFPNEKAYSLYVQYNNTAEFLMKNSIVKYYNEVVITQRGKNCIISAPGHVVGGKNSEKFFNSIEQYYECIENAYYHIIFYDYSIARFYYEFDGADIKKHSLLWWPCPFNSTARKAINPCDEIDELRILLEENISKDRISMRTPIRIDFSDEDRKDHPATHLHMQNSETRLYVNKPICINKFMHYIMQTNYSSDNINLSNLEYLVFEGVRECEEYDSVVQINFM